MDDDCREILASMRTYLDGECPDDLEEVVVRHLGDCPPCMDRAEFERELRAIVKSKCKDAAPPGLLDRVIGTIQP